MSHKLFRQTEESSSVLAVLLVSCGKYSFNMKVIETGVLKGERNQSKAKEIFGRMIDRCSEVLEIEKAEKSICQGVR